jgi:hypothetical protein
VAGIVGQVYAQAVALGVRAGRTRVRLGHGRSGHGSGRTCPPRPARELGSEVPGARRTGLSAASSLCLTRLAAPWC